MASSRSLFVSLGLNSRGLDRGLKKSEGKFAKFGRRVGRKLKQSFSAISLGGAFGFGSAFKDVMSFEDMLTDLEIQGNATKDQMDALRGTINQLSKDNGQSKNTLAGLAKEMVDLEGAAGLSADKFKVLADAAFAASASAPAMAGLSLSLGNSFDVKSAEDTKRAIDGYIVAGKSASIPLEDLNEQLQANGAQWSIFSGKGVDAAIGMASALQTIRKQSSSPAEAGTRLKALLGVLLTNEVALGKLGIATRDTAGGYREVMDIVKDIDASGITEDATKFNAAFGKRKEARAALKALTDLGDQYEENFSAAKKGGAIDEDIAKRRAKTSTKYKIAMNNLRNAFAKAFTPERVEKFVDAISTLADVLMVLVDNLKAVAAAYVGLKAGGMLMSAAGAMGGPSAGALMASGGAKGLSGAMATAGGLLVAGFAGFKFGEWLDSKFKFSDALSDTLMAAAGPIGRVAGSNDRSMKGLHRDMKFGAISKEKYEELVQGKRNAFAFRGANQLTDVIAAKTRGITGTSAEAQRARFGKLSDAKKKEVWAMARDALIAQNSGDDAKTQALVDKLAKAIAGRPVKVELESNTMSEILDNATGYRTGA